MIAVALLVSGGAGLGAVAFRYLVYGVTWLATGHTQFGQDGYVGSSHLPWLGLGFFVLIPATFNAPITGIFFGVEIILREFSVDAICSVMLSAVLADVVAEQSWAAGRSWPRSLTASPCTMPPATCWWRRWP
jgi:H+/Cl- antiporter ClcA